jgi:hypothetical protein
MDTGSAGFIADQPTSTHATATPDTQLKPPLITDNFKRIKVEKEQK